MNTYHIMVKAAACAVVSGVVIFLVFNVLIDTILGLTDRR